MTTVLILPRPHLFPLPSTTSSCLHFKGTTEDSVHFPPAAYSTEKLPTITPKTGGNILSTIPTVLLTIGFSLHAQLLTHH